MPHIDNDVLKSVIDKYGEDFGEFDPDNQDILYFLKKRWRNRMYNVETVTVADDFFESNRNKYDNLHEAIVNASVGYVLKIDGFENEKNMNSFVSTLYYGRTKDALRSQGCTTQKKVDKENLCVYVKKIKELKGDTWDGMLTQ